MAQVSKSSKLHPEVKEDTSNLALQAEAYFLRLQDCQNAYLEWLESETKVTHRVDRYQFKKIR